MSSGLGSAHPEAPGFHLGTGNGGSWAPGTRNGKVPGAVGCLAPCGAVPAWGFMLVIGVVVLPVWRTLRGMRRAVSLRRGSPGDTALARGPDGGVFPDDPHAAISYLRAFNHLEALALSPEATTRRLSNLAGSQ